MDTLSITEAKNRLTEIADRAAAEHDHFTVTRNGRPHVMVVSVAEWDELQETLAVLSDPQTRADLAEAAEAAERGDFTTGDEMQAILDARWRTNCRRVSPRPRHLPGHLQDRRGQAHDRDPHHQAPRRRIPHVAASRNRAAPVACV
jgi:antitoxin YefM